MKPDYEMPTDANMDNVYEVTVVATDAAGNRGMAMVTVTVENENENGVVTLSKTQPQDWGSAYGQPDRPGRKHNRPQMAVVRHHHRQRPYRGRNRRCHVSHLHADDGRPWRHPFGESELHRRTRRRQIGDGRSGEIL